INYYDSLLQNDYLTNPGSWDQLYRGRMSSQHTCRGDCYAFLKDCCGGSDLCINIRLHTLLTWCFGCTVGCKVVFVYEVIIEKHCAVGDILKHIARVLRRDISCGVIRKPCILCAFEIRLASLCHNLSMFYSNPAPYASLYALLNPLPGLFGSPPPCGSPPVSVPCREINALLSCISSNLYLCEKSSNM